VISHFGAFLAVSVVVIVTPGPDTALTVKNALLGARRGGVFTAAGVATGQAIWAVFAGVGIAALLEAVQPAYLAIRIAGASYLIYLGLHALIGAFRTRSGRAPAARATSRGIGAAPAYRQGLLSDLANPKMVVFFVSLLPQFTGGDPSFAPYLVLGFIFSLLTFVWLTGYAIAVAKAGDVLRRPRIRRAVDAITGLVLVAFGLRLASEPR
jgi:threonine/homoserine/homoserine lactone efflux protein